MKLKLRILVVALVFVTIMSAFAPAAMALEGKLTGTINFREGPGEEYSSYGKVKNGTVVTVLDVKSNDGWYKISHNGKEGYMVKDYVELLSSPTVTATIKSGTQLRQSANTASSALTNLKKGDQVEVIEQEAAKNWALAEYGGIEGYILTSMLDYTNTVKADTVSSGLSSSSSSTSTSSSSASSTTKNVDAYSSQIATAKKKNSDTIGWINIPNSTVNDPILYRSGFYYADRDFNHKKALTSVYPHTNVLTRNVVIYGHNLRGSGKGMHDLHHLQEVAEGYSRCQYSGCKKDITSLAGWQNSEAGRVWDISIFGKTKWEVFAMYETPKNEPKATLSNNWTVNPANMKTWISGQISRSKINFGVSVSERDTVMTIITCGTNYDSATATSRLFIFLKCVG